MAKILRGDRIGLGSSLVVGCSAVLFDQRREKILLTRRQDNGQWCIPGGHMEPGESAEEACVREVLEETGLKVRVRKLVGIYTSPNRIIQYRDGNQYQPVSLHFEVEVLGGALQTNDETTAFGYYSLDEIREMDFMDHLYPRVLDTVAGQDSAFFR